MVDESETAKAGVGPVTNRLRSIGIHQWWVVYERRGDSSLQWNHRPDEPWFEVTAKAFEVQFSDKLILHYPKYGIYLINGVVLLCVVKISQWDFWRMWDSASGMANRSVWTFKRTSLPICQNGIRRPLFRTIGLSRQRISWAQEKYGNDLER